jgi:glycosyltransferase involved in cell wall biosynthesis
VGNSTWGRYAGYADHKGLRGIVEPALALAAARGVPIAPRIHDRARAWLPRAKVIELLQALDVYLCASQHEGTALPVLEAMACGIPVVSTRVGMLPEVAGPLQQQLIVERTAEAFATALGRLAGDPQLRADVGAENRARAEALTWERCGRGWADFFDGVIGDARRGGGGMTEDAVYGRALAWSERADRVLAGAQA